MSDLVNFMSVLILTTSTLMILMRALVLIMSALVKFMSALIGIMSHLIRATSALTNLMSLLMKSTSLLIAREISLMKFMSPFVLKRTASPQISNDRRASYPFCHPAYFAGTSCNPSTTTNPSVPLLLTVTVTLFPWGSWNLPRLTAPPLFGSR